jgi:hypothetical protein
MNLTAVDVKRTLDNRLVAAGLEPALDKNLEQILSFPEGYFVEVVLHDANRLGEVENVVESARQDLEKQGIKIEAVVRCIWKVASVKYHGTSQESVQGLKFRAQLVSGSRNCDVSVILSIGALDVLRKKLYKDRTLVTFEWTPEKGDLDEDTIALVVQCFLEDCVSAGGNNFWDPIRHPRQELSQAAMSRLLGEGQSFIQIRQAVDDALEPPLLASFLRSLASRGTKITAFQEILPELSNVLGGPYSPGDVFSTSSTALFVQLREVEQKLIERYYRRKLDSALEQFPHLRHEYPQLF